MTMTTFTVPDMTCAHCEKTILSALAQALPGETSSVDLAAHEVRTSGDAVKALEAMQEAGYTPQRKV